MTESSAHSEQELIEPLTPRELDILRLKTEEDHQTRRQVAERLGIGENPVASHINHINQKPAAKCLPTYSNGSRPIAVYRN